MNEELVIPQPIIPSPWDDNRTESDHTLTGFIDYIDSLDQEDIEENEIQDPTTLPVELAQESHLTTITAANYGNAVKVGRVIYADTLPDLPNTAEDGVAYIVDISTKSPEEIKILCDGVMYSHAAVGSTDKRSSSSILNDAKIERTNMICTGVQYCEYLAEDIKAMDHTAVTPEMLNIIRERRVQNGADSRKKDANSFYFAERQKFLDKTACLQPLNSCRWRFISEASETVSGTPRYLIQCINTRPRSRLHYARSLPLKYRYEIDFLAKRFNNEDTGVQPESCHVVEYNGARRKRCGVDHYQGQGKIVKVKCGVKFIRILPHELKDYPYLIWVSIGIHTHPPPAINKTPKEIRQGLLDVIRRINDPCLTRNSLLKNPYLLEFCHRFNGSTLRDVHISLANEDKLEALIYKQRALSYPYGQGIAAVEYEYRTKHRDRKDAYIQDVYNDGENIIIICFYQRQVEVLLEQAWFQCDMAFKRLKNPKEKEVIFAIMNKQNNKTFTLLRVFVNQESTEMYYQMFLRVFSLIEERSQTPIRWQHLHGEGFAAMVMDMDTKQLPGFGLYLSHIDPRNRPWQWQVQHSTVYCLIHFKRGVERAVKKGYGKVDKSPYSPYSHLLQLLFCKTVEEYSRLCDELSSKFLIYS